MLSYRRDFGVSSVLELDVGSLLLQLYLAEGLVPEFVASISKQNSSFQLNMGRMPSTRYQVFIQFQIRVAVEKLNLTAVADAFLEENYTELASGIGGGAFLTLIFLIFSY